MNPASHPGDELLVSHAAGVCREAVSLFVATHLVFCSRCQGKVAEAEAIGGALLCRLPPAKLGCVPDEIVAGLRDDDRSPPPVPPLELQVSTVPVPLRAYVGQNIRGGRWIPVAPGFSYRSVLARGTTRVRLLRCAPGARMADHTHRGSELTLVLSGGFCDATGQYLRGDVQMAGSELVHAPVADRSSGCVCLVVVDAPLKFAGRVAGILTKLSGF